LELSKVKEENKSQRGQLSQKEVQLEVALQHQQMLQNAGISRANLMSNDWHKRNKFASRYLLGIGSDWNEYQLLVMALFFDYGVEQVNGGSGTFTPFEKVMMTTMKVKQNFDVTTIALIFGCSIRHVGRIINEWAPALRFVCAVLTDLDIDLAHDYMSFADCERLVVPHFRTRHNSSDMSSSN